MSRAIVTAAVLLSALWLIPASPIAPPAVAGPASVPAAGPATVTVHLPPGKLFARIWLQRPRPKDGVFFDVEKYGVLVAGDLKLEKGAQYRLHFKYDGAQDVS
ncbi:MAG TPA: hypothetical protein V6C69_19160, partial [Trichormus sp.]